MSRFFLTMWKKWNSNRSSPKCLCWWAVYRIHRLQRLYIFIIGASFKKKKTTNTHTYTCVPLRTILPNAVSQRNPRPLEVPLGLCPRKVWRGLQPQCGWKSPLPLKMTHTRTPYDIIARIPVTQRHICKNTISRKPCTQQLGKVRSIIDYRHTLCIHIYATHHTH